MYIGDLGWGPRTRHLVFTTLVPLFLWGGNYAASRRTAGGYTYIGHLNGSKGRHTRPYGNLTAIYNQVEAWYEWQTGQDRQSGLSYGSQSGDLMVFFLPLM